MEAKHRVRTDRVEVVCGHCSKVLQKDNIQSHTERYHKGKKVQYVMKLDKGEQRITPFLKQTKDESAVVIQSDGKEREKRVVIKPPMLGVFSAPKVRLGLSGVKVAKSITDTSSYFPPRPVLPVTSYESMEAHTKRNKERSPPASADVAKRVKTSDCQEFSAQEFDNTLHLLQAESSIASIKQTLAKIEPQLSQFQQKCLTSNVNSEARNLPLVSNQEKILRDHVCKEFHMCKTTGDGNCLYNAVSNAVFGCENYSGALRLLELDHILKNETELREVSPKIFGIPFEELVRKTKKLGEWGGEKDMYILSAALRRPILSHQTGGKTCATFKFLWDNEDAKKTPIYMYHSGDHFSTMVPKVESVNTMSVDTAIPIYNNFKNKYETYMLDEDPAYLYTDEDLEIIADVQATNYKLQKLFAYVDGQKTRSEDDVILLPAVQQNDESVKMEEKAVVPVTDFSDAVSTDPTYVPLTEKEDTSSSSSGLEVSHNKLLQHSESSESSVDLPKINRKLNKITEMMHNINVRETRQREPEVGGEIILEGVNSINQILEKHPCLKTRKIEEDALENDLFTEIACSYCFDDLLGKRAGRFKYHSSLGVDFGDDNMPREFRNLKKSLKEHLLSKTHRANAAEHEKEIQYQTKLKEANREIGMRVGKLAYTAIKSDANMSKFEDYVALQSSLGMDVGELNHGRKFCRDFSNACYLVLREELKKVLDTPNPLTKRPPPFSITADKYTPSRVTGQIVGLTVFTGGKLVDFNVDYGKIDDYTGLGIAKALHQSLTDLVDDDTLKTRMVGGCFDGEYLKKGVVRHLLSGDQLDLRPEQKNWYSFDWDRSHVLELGIEEATNASRSFKAVNDTVHHINKKYRVGKAYAAAIKEAEVQNLVMKAPIQDSATRFAQHHSNVLSNFHNNYKIFYHRLNSERDPDLQKIENVGFVLGLTAQEDIMKEVTKFSLICQKPGLYPWRLKEHAASTFSKLQEMVNSIPQSFDEPNFDLHEGFVSLKEAITSLKEESPTFCNVPVTLSKYFTKKTRHRDTESQVFGLENHMQNLRDDLQSFVSQLKTSFNTRIQQNTPPTHILIEKSFALEQVLQNAENLYTPPELLEYLKLAKNCDYIYDVTDDEITEQYREFSQIVKRLYDDKVKVRPSLADNKVELENEIYTKICNSQTSANISDVGHLLLSAIVRSNSEASCESAGSVVNQILSNRSEDFKNTKKELFIAVNGPQPYASRTPELIEKSLNHHFASGDWHFKRKTKRESVLTHFSVSQVVDRKVKEADEQARLFSKRK